MGIREMTNQKPGLTAACVAGVIAVALVAVITLNRDPSDHVSSAYYSDDDGKSWFSDSADKVYPFDHGGKRAYRAYVYQCPDGKKFVSYLERYPDDAAGKLTELLSRKSDPAVAGQIAALRGTSSQVKKPGGADWVGTMSARGNAITPHPQCPDGTTATNIWP